MSQELGTMTQEDLQAYHDDLNRFASIERHLVGLIRIFMTELIQLPSYVSPSTAVDRTHYMVMFLLSMVLEASPLVAQDRYSKNPTPSKGTYPPPALVQAIRALHSLPEKELWCTFLESHQRNIAPSIESCLSPHLNNITFAYDNILNYLKELNHEN